MKRKGDNTSKKVSSRLRSTLPHNHLSQKNPIGGRKISCTSTAYNNNTITPGSKKKLTTCRSFLFTREINKRGRNGKNKKTGFFPEIKVELLFVQAAG